MIVIHHGLNTIGNTINSGHAHQGIRDHGFLVDFLPA